MIDIATRLIRNEICLVLALLGIAGHFASPMQVVESLIAATILFLLLLVIYQRGWMGGGDVKLLKYTAVDDCGNIINPLIVEGQLHGGIAQGIAQALFEEVSYDPQTGQLLTGTLADYLVPTANEIPSPLLDRTVTPSPTNELGVKGIGEAGTIAASAAVINAIVDALRPLGISHVDMPASPDRLWKQIRQAQEGVRA